MTHLISVPLTKLRQLAVRAKHHSGSSSAAQDQFYLRELIAPILPIGMASGSVALLILWAATWIGGDHPNGPRTLVSLVGSVTLLALAGQCRRWARRGRIVPTVLSVVVYGWALSSVACILAWMDDLGLLTVMPLCMALVVIGSFFALRLWHLAAGFITTMSPAVILAIRIDPNASNEGDHYPQVLALTATTGLTFYLLTRHLKMLYYNALMDSEERANRDSMTTLLNRSAWYEHAERILSARNTDDAATSVLYLDIDHFKRINDRFGHGAGDDVLIEMARLLEESLPDAAIAARFGGEEFVVLLRECDVDAARVAAARVHERLRITLDDHPQITVSAGVACHHPGESIDDLIYRADMALLRAKEKGRDRFEVAPNLPHRHVSSRESRPATLQTTLPRTANTGN